MNNSTAENGFYEQLDSGIRPFVEVLRKEGIRTFESCQGGEGHALPEPIIRFHGNTNEGYKAFSIAMNNDLPVLELRRTYDVEEGHLIGPHWELVFKTQALG